MSRFYITLIAFTLILLSCSSEDMDDKSEDPSNLTVQLELAQDNSGLVQVTATADNALYFEFHAKDADNTILTDTGGDFEYRYEFSGIYEAEIRAYGSSGRYLSVFRQVIINTDNEVDTSLGYATPLSYEGMNLVWNDEFNGNSIDSRNWTFDIGDGCPSLCGWGNNELQYYRTQNCLVGNGVLTITGEDTPFASRDYTSGKMLTRDKYTFRYGRVDVRAKMPEGKGFWPAVWMLGRNHASVGWPQCGEIDIVEMIGGSESVTHGTAHWLLDGGPTNMGGSRTGTKGLHEEFHVFSIVWDEEFIRWYLNDIEYYSLDITSPSMDAFHKEFFLIVNLAVGGNWPGSPNASTVFPSSVVVDYIRVFQKA